MKTKLYLAYGSNLNIRAMRLRCPDAEPIGKTNIRNMRLVFRAVADIAPAKGLKVPVGVWRISRKDEKALDRYEGVAGGLYRKITVRLSGGDEALCYRMNDTGIMAPSESYLATIREGYEDFDLDPAHLDAALDYTIKRYSPTDKTWTRFAARTRREQRAEARAMFGDFNWKDDEFWNPKLAEESAE